MVSWFACMLLPGTRIYAGCSEMSLLGQRLPSSGPITSLHLTRPCSKALVRQGSAKARKIMEEGREKKGGILTWWLISRKPHFG